MRDEPLGLTVHSLPAPQQAAQADAQRYGRASGLEGYEALLGLSSGVMHRHHVERLELSERERELLGLLSAGHSNAQIAELRHRSPATVRNQVWALYQKLGVARRAEAIAKATALNMSGSKSWQPLARP